MSTATNYLTSTVGLAKIGSIVAGIVTTLVVSDAVFNSGHFQGTMECGGAGCAMRSDSSGCPSKIKAGLTFAIVLLATLASSGVLITFLILFKKLRKLPLFWIIDLIGHVLATALILWGAIMCFQWANASYTKEPCDGPNKEGCEAKRTAMLQPVMFIVSGVVAIVCSVIYGATAFYVFKSKP